MQATVGRSLSNQLLLVSSISSVDQRFIMAWHKMALLAMAAGLLCMLALLNGAEASGESASDSPLLIGSEASGVSVSKQHSIIQRSSSIRGECPQQLEIDK